MIKIRIWLPLVLLLLLFIIERKGYLKKPESLEIIPTVAQHPVSEINANISVEINDLLMIVYALERYKRDHWSYPKSSHGGTKWDGIFSIYGESREDWVPEIVPKYINQLPRDPRMLADGTKQYIYVSNGISYKLIAHNVDNCAHIKKIYPILVDPKRDCFAYGFWTKNAALW